MQLLTVSRRLILYSSLITIYKKYYFRQMSVVNDVVVYDKDYSLENLV